MSQPVDFDVIIVGGGPGGSACARFLGEKGVSVLLLDKASFPRDKTCGDAVSGKSLKVLHELGIKEKVAAKPNGKVKGVLLSAPNGKSFVVSMSKPGETETNAYCVRREILDNVLFEHATKVCQFREKVQVMGLLKEHEQVVGVKIKDLSLEKEQELRAHLVIGADGATSVVARELQVSQIPSDHNCVAVRGYYENVSGVQDNIELHFVDELIPGYFWIFPLEGNMCNVGVGMVMQDMQKRKLNLVDEMKKALEKEPFKSRFANAKLHGDIKGWTLPFGSHKRKLVYNGAMLVGDAACLVDPFTGEGIGNALTSGKLAAEMALLALEKKDFSQTFLQPYENNVWKELGAELDLSYQLQKYSKHKPLINFIFSRAQKNPKIAAALSEMLVNETPREKTLSPFGLIKLLLS